MKGLSKKQNKTKTPKQKNTPHRPRQHMVITRGKGGWEEVEEGKGGMNSDGRRLNSGW